MIGGWLPAVVRHELQDALIDMQQLVTLGKITIEEANAAIRMLVAVMAAVADGTITEDEGEALIMQAVREAHGESEKPS